jgi:hypothetical protein
MAKALEDMTNEELFRLFPIVAQRTRSNLVKNYWLKNSDRKKY